MKTDPRIGYLPKISSKEKVPTKSKISDVREAQNGRQSDTGGLKSLLESKINATVMLTANI